MLRFDLRNPVFAGITSSERLQAAVDMAAWADTRGGIAISVSEHHGSDDGYLPSPLLFAAAVAARTRNVRIRIDALIASFYDPLRLAEDLAVVDNLSGGRVDVVLGGGYVPDEFRMFGVPTSEGGRRVEEVVVTLRNAWRGAPFEFRGRIVRVTPAPDRPGGPSLVLGGSSAAAARRAARIADGYIPSTPESWEAYRQERLALGKSDPGPSLQLPLVTMFLAEDPDSAWEELLPYFLHETNAYGAWLEAAGLDGPYPVATEGALRKSGRYRILTPADYAAELKAMGRNAVAFFNPMVGGIPPRRGWDCLRLFEEQVLPRFT
ncbi:MAG TPA: LLM class flavin-dependent oxidoreductase [Deltaproteobacteria bacterium]|nr:LLM class flavin-dependent oxidoreductase [Deltaproteobacteria bacterium]